ncbi:hypothetical protein PENSPDRAFT_691419 [Peniophora sp. CONT]|nr:hypothetical protein PENSPDRAFT_691419 [Peniophora sp. CONT]
MDDAISCLQEHRNSLLSVHRLPPEILRMIFLFAVLGDNVEYTPSPSRGPVVNTVHTLATTSKRFRIVALEISAFWRVLPARNLELTRTSLEHRIGENEVVLRVRNDDPTLNTASIEHMNFLLSAAADRIGIMDIWVAGIGHDTGAALLKRLVRDHFPRLHALHVLRHEDAPGPAWAAPEPFWPADIGPIADALRGGKLDRLTLLNLSACGCIPVQYLPESLEHMELRNTFGSRTLNQTIKSIGRLQRLRTLVLFLEDRFARGNIDLPEEKDLVRVSLGGVRRLELEGPWDVCASLLDGFALAASCAIRVGARRMSIQDEPYTKRVMATLQEHWARHGQQSFSSITVAHLTQVWPTPYGTDIIEVVVDDSQSNPPLISLYVPLQDVVVWERDIPLHVKLEACPCVRRTRRLRINGDLSLSMSHIPFQDAREIMWRVEESEDDDVPELLAAARILPYYADLDLVEWRDLRVPQGDERTLSDFDAMINALVLSQREIELRFTGCSLSTDAINLVRWRTAHMDPPVTVVGI